MENPLTALRETLGPRVLKEVDYPTDKIEKFKILVITREARPLMAVEERDLVMLKHAPEVKDLLKRLRNKTYRA